MPQIDRKFKIFRWQRRNVAVEEPRQQRTAMVRLGLDEDVRDRASATVEFVAAVGHHDRRPKIRPGPVRATAQQESCIRAVERQGDLNRVVGMGKSPPCFSSDPETASRPQANPADPGDP